MRLGEDAVRVVQGIVLGADELFALRHGAHGEVSHDAEVVATAAESEVEVWMLVFADSDDCCIGEDKL